MDDISLEEFGKFDLIHSTGALIFSTSPEKFIASCAKMLNDDGILLFSTGHPLYAGDWLTFDNYNSGLFIKNYFFPQPDIRFDKDGNEIVRSCFYPIGIMADWILNANLKIERIMEPESMPMDLMDEDLIKQKVPYSSQSWCALYEQFSNVPGAVIFKSMKEK